MKCTNCNKSFVNKYVLKRHNENEICLQKHNNSEFSYQCEYCNNLFSSLKYLHSHQKYAKYCLDKQKKDEFKCTSCNSIFITNIDKTNHILSCVEYYKDKIDDLEKTKILEINSLEHDISSLQYENGYLKQQISFANEQKEKYEEQVTLLQQQIISITKSAISKPTNLTNNNNYNNKIMNMSIMNLDNENTRNIMNDRQKYNLDVISKGQKGLAIFALENLLKDSNGNINYFCTDQSRKIFKHKNESGEIEKDINATKLTSHLIENGMLESTIEISTNHWTKEDGSTDIYKYNCIIEKASEINEIQRDNLIFKNELASRTCI